MSDPNLVTTYNLHGHDYMVKMNVINGFLELVITDKHSGEEWQCSYDNSYIENLTHKTGNYKQFDIFVTMLKSGLLKTSTSISLDLLTYEDLESMRIRRFKSSSTRNLGGGSNNNRRYLIITYTVEFDRIHYPLPLEYCGPPDPAVLQATIRKLRSELTEARETSMASCVKQESKKVLALQAKVDELFAENLELREKITHLRQLSNARKPQQNLKNLQTAICSLEKSVASERKSHHQLVEKLKKENEVLLKEVTKIKHSEKTLKQRLQHAIDENVCLKKKQKQPPSVESVRTMFRRRNSPIYVSPDATRARSLSPRTMKDTSWEQQKSKSAEPGMRIRKINSNIKSRSSSRESVIRVSDLTESSETESERRRPYTSPSRIIRKQMTKPKSGSSRGSSVDSSASIRTKKSDSLHLMLRNSEFEFKNLEERIEGLHSLLKTNFS